METLNTAQLIALILASGGATGGMTFAAIRVHINYMTQNTKRHEKRLDDIDNRLALADQKAEAAHHRIDLAMGGQPNVVGR